MKRIINTIIMIVCGLVFLYSLYSIVSWFIENKRNNSVKEHVIELTNIETKKDEYPFISTDFANLLNENDKVKGWILVPDTNINYPVLQYSNNSYYLTHNFYDQYTTAGWVFLDYRNKLDRDTNTILYAHNRLDGSMFGTLKNTLDEEWHSNNKYIYFNTLNSMNTYEVFSVYTIDVKDFLGITNFSTEKKYEAYLNNIINLSTIKLNVSVTKDDKIITLYTCNARGETKRTVLHGKLVQSK